MACFDENSIELDEILRDCVENLFDLDEMTVGLDGIAVVEVEVAEVLNASCARLVLFVHVIRAFGRQEVGSFACPCPCAVKSPIDYQFSCLYLAIVRQPIPSPLAYYQSHRLTFPYRHFPRYRLVAYVA